jgi:glycosyltransferase involved in cell wall biosynthesis
VYLLSLVEALAPRLPLELLVSDRASDEVVRRTRACGVPVTPIPELARRPSPAAVMRLARVLRRRQPALVHVNLSDQGDGLVANAAARLAVSATLHIVLPDRRPALERLSRLALRRTRTVIAVSEAVGGYLASQSVSHCVVRNGVAPPAPLPDARAALGLEPDAFVVGGVGRLDAQKGWDVLCAAAPQVRARVPGARFAVVGDGPERASLTALGTTAGVDFAGYHEQAAGLMAAFDVLVVPSRYEGFGLVAVEAMLAGVPVVASGVGGLVEVVGDAGRLIPPDDPAALAEALASLAESSDLRAELARRGAERARACFGHERMVTETFAAWKRAGSLTDPVNTGVISPA